MNYETKAVSTWLSNDEGLYSYWKEVAEEYKGEWIDAYEPDVGREENDVSGLAERLKDELGEVPESLSGMHKDLLASALNAVDWQELAQDLLDE